MLTTDFIIEYIAYYLTIIRILFNEDYYANFNYFN